MKVAHRWYIEPVCSAKNTAHMIWLVFCASSDPENCVLTDGRESDRGRWCSSLLLQLAL